MTRIYRPIFLCFLPSLAFARPTLEHMKRTPGGIHLPIQRNYQRKLERRDGQTGSVGLGDVADVTYNVLITVGSIQTPVVLDTGSSDLWVLSDSCSGNCTPGVPLFPMAQFNSSNVDAQLLYGDSLTGTHAFGPIGTTTASLAGLSMPDQYFAAINDTNTSVLDTGSAGIFGLGFPINSVIFGEVFSNEFPDTPSQDLRKRTESTDYRRTRFPTLPSRLKAKGSKSTNYHRSAFPNLPSRLASTKSRKINARQSDPSAGTIDDVLAAFSTIGPLVSRLAETGQLAAPQMTISLQRDSIDIGGNVGVLSLGELPEGVSNDSLTWVPIRGYTPEQGGLPPPSDSPNEVYPIAWEVPIDNVFLDGVQLGTSNLSDPSIELTALIDTGNSLIRGPADVVNNIYTTVTGSSNTRKETYPCSMPHTLSFQIGGQMFPIDPRDFPSQSVPNKLQKCFPNVVSTDPPGTGFLYSWSLGDPFLKSVLVSFYYGNLTHPSVDPPRMGFMSTVPANANDLLAAAVASASANGNNFPSVSVTAPASVPTGNGYGDLLIGSGSSSPSSTSSAALGISTGDKAKGNSAMGIRVSNSWVGLIFTLILSFTLLC